MPENCREKTATLADLINDLKQCIIDFISLPSDLRNLCLVCKSWNSIAKKRLYEHVTLSGNAQVIVFDRCLDWGASNHLQHTRKLSILEAWDDNIQETLVRDSYGLVDPNNNTGRELRQQSNTAVMRLLRFLLDNRLHTVTLLTITPLDMNCLDYLLKHQQRLTNLHINTIPLPWIERLTFRDITIGFHTVHDKTHRLGDLLERLSSHATLTLAFWDGWTSDVHQYWLRWATSMMRTIALQQLTVYGSMPDSFWAAVSGRLDLSHLTSLTLIKCGFELLESLHSTIQSLVNLHICLGSSLGESRLLILEDIFNTNVELRRVHLNIYDSEFEYDPRDNLYNIIRISNSSVPLPLKERAYLWPLRHRLKSLSLNDGGFMEHFADEDVRAGYGPRWYASALEELNEICRHFQTLQQLGWNVCEPHTPSEELDLLESLKQLEDLRVFHAYQQYFTFSKHHRCGCKDVVSHLQHFAVQFFRQLHAHCPRLEIFVWGLCGGLLTPGGVPLGEEMNGSAPVRQHIFVKTTAVLPDGERQITAVKVSRAWLRYEYPDLDLLQYDPGLFMADPGTQLLGW